MKPFIAALAFCWTIAAGFSHARACSIVYYSDTVTGKVYIANNEDYWYRVKPYLQVIPEGKTGYARLWYGWNDFAQGGVNAFGLFFDGAATPQQEAIAGYEKPKGNLGDRILASCRTVNEALALLEQEKVALTSGHLFLGDRHGDAVVVEWVNGKKNLEHVKNHVLLATNFLLTDTTKGNYPCPRYNAMQNEITRLRENREPIDLRAIGNVAAKAVQPPSANHRKEQGGTLYSTFINLTDMEFVVVYKLDAARTTRFNLKEELAHGKKRRIPLE